jgi:hypothetical protein
MPMIVFNGKTYNSMDEMPANERQAYEQVANMLVDKNGNGIPDFLEGDLAKNITTVFTSSVNINGKNYNNVDELPPDVRARVQGAFEKLSELGIVTKIPPPDAQADPTPTPVSEPFVSREYNPVIQEEKTNPLIWVMIGMGLMLCLAIAAVGIFYLMNN